MTVMETMNDTKRPLPDGWRWVQLGEVCEIRMGETLIQRDLTGDGIPVFSANTSAEPWGYTTHGRLIFEEKSIVVGARGSIGFPRWPNLPQWTATQTTIVLTCSNSEVMTATWLLRVLQCVDFKKMTAQQAIPMMTVADIERLEIPLSPLHEQKRIVGVLREQMAAVEKAHTAAQTRLAAVKDLPAAFLRDAFSPARIKEWGVTTVNEIASLVIDGPHVTPSYVTQGIPFVTVKNIHNGHLDFSALSYITEEDHRQFCRRGQAERGDILYTKDGTLGIPCVVDTDEEFSFFVSVALIKLRREIAVPEFVAYAMKSRYVLHQVDRLGAGAGLKHMVLKSIRALVIPCPSLEEQRLIAGMLREQMAAVEKARAAAEEELKTINALPSALLRRAFKGEL